MPVKKKKVVKKTTRKTPVKKNEVGRPTKYDKKYCEVILEYMSKGYSKEACAGAIGISKSTLYEWAKAYPDFSNAISIGTAKSQLFWESMACEHTLHSKNGKQINGQVYNLNMKNRFGWSDKKEITTEEKDTKKTFAFDLLEEPEE